MKTMKILLGLVLGYLAIIPAISYGQVKPHDASTAAMVELCKARNDIDAQNFCFGFGEGVYQAYLASRPAGAKPNICFGSSNHTREQVLEDFLKWNQQNPQFNQEQAAKTLVRFFKQRYPCKS
ncbi:Rap1a/Tai family immunity protein [Polynucleobacter sp. HIN6]|uniref:Rap1a/Tai family immunity protein n=2 Tax=unclassified Polynucleobacter TaxID=2640945 RepID=UPI00257469A0|nr:Rap1a/Tai family immunity protein [Polynucleobacter sp. HIN6]